MALSSLQNLVIQDYISSTLGRRIDSPTALGPDPQVLANQVQQIIMAKKTEIQAAMLVCTWAENTFSAEAIATQAKADSAAAQSALATKAEQDRAMLRQAIMTNRANISREEQRRKVNPSAPPQIDLAAAKGALQGSEEVFAQRYGKAALTALGVK